MNSSSSIFPHHAYVPQALIDWASGLSSRQSKLYIAVSFGLIALLDWASGPAYTMVALYFLPISIAAWSFGFRVGLATGMVCALIQSAINGMGDPWSPAAAVSVSAAGWNFLMRLLGLMLLVMLVAGFRRSYETERRRARTDDLTGALTKQALHDQLRRMLGAERRALPVLVFLYSDLDGFKQVNDQHGHDAGDIVLIDFADAAMRTMRPRDVLARVGGDEFVMLLPVPSVADGYSAAQRMHRDISQSLETCPYPVTCSMGALVVEHGNADREATFLKMADNLMYEVKRAGKNALRVAHVDLDKGDPAGTRVSA
ncbi:GGDEF domain-containing protein [Sphingomonas oleivorans]|nr:GGDEF domain-containing protein [Sphingomonas oleivorans]